MNHYDPIRHSSIAGFAEFLTSFNAADLYEYGFINSFTKGNYQYLKFPKAWLNIIPQGFGVYNREGDRILFSFSDAEFFLKKSRRIIQLNLFTKSNII